MTPEEIAELERSLRKARQDVFSKDDKVSAAASAEITRCKDALKPMWEERARKVDYEIGQRLLYTWA